MNIGSEDVDCPPEMLWHYTTDAGFRGIVENQVLWATDALYLNDSSELSAALDLQRRTFVIHDPQTRLEKLFSTITSPLVDSLLPQEGIFLASFSAARDQLSQWRGYGGANGYALGVSQAALLAGAEGYGCELAKVEYGTPNENLVNRLRPTALVAGEGRASIDGDVAATALLKDSSFHEEQEWRIVATRPAQELRFRAGSIGLIPYIELPFPRTLITEVMLGPGLGGDRATRAVERLLESLGHEAEVTSSRVPFRA